MAASATASASASSSTLFSTLEPQFSLSSNRTPFHSKLSLPRRQFRLPNRPLTVSAAVSSPAPVVSNSPGDFVSSILSKIKAKLAPNNAGDLVSDILSKVTETDRGVLLTKEEQKEVGEIAEELQKYCVDAPVKCPLIFGEWDVVYCSNPTSPGGGYRSAIGRLVFKTNEMIQVVEAPDIVRNKVSFSAFGFLDGEVSLKGKLIALDESWIQVIFEAPELKVGGLEFQYGGQSEVKLQITYVDKKVRLGKGSRGSLFVFQRR
ncbi:probable plastid-lipid-associated protein 8, chloroplastic [Chenopodium quinoa]|uniref:probable plastid-lipid-associated protein 8, chloroplastic n=1 Tax=Chenopodium quinoa TaxID=63459 RepID=UPI000B76C393|nr:probable plastid-lipid-associated protein 8, chloroplastic [Chenopodium quinoa]